MYYRNNIEQECNTNESEIITTENRDGDRRKHAKKYMQMPYMMAPMSYCPSMETCPMKESCPMMGGPNLMAQMDPDDPDPRFGRRRFHHFHHHFHHHFFRPFFPFFR